MQAERSSAAPFAPIARRILPVLFIAYVIAYLDRVNVGFAKLQMLAALHFSETQYGIGAGMFFAGYFVFGVPANLILHRLGARRWLAACMLAWGLLSAATAWVERPQAFYALRGLLGVAEAGFFPGVIWYFGRWFAPGERARITTVFMSAIAVCGALGGPVSGWILERFDGWQGLAGWQWLFLLEAAPAVLVAAWLGRSLVESPAQADWLSVAERRALATLQPAEPDRAGGSGLPGLRLGRVWLLCVLYFCAVVGLYGITFWLPTILRELEVSSVRAIGALSFVPYAVAAVTMIAVGRSADRRKEYRWHLAVAGVVGALGLALSVAASGHLVAALAALTLATAGILCVPPLIWNVPVGFPDPASAAAGIALINSFGNLAGFLSPYLVGTLKDRTGSTATGMALIAGIVLCGAGLTAVALRPQHRAAGEGCAAPRSRATVAR